jgi:hypothetical protein
VDSFYPETSLERYKSDRPAFNQLVDLEELETQAREAKRGSDATVGIQKE